MMITSYSFGCMEIDGKQYRKDLILLPDRTLLHPWWRKAGHTLSIADVLDVVARAPDILVVGTGSPGMMQPDGKFCRELESRGTATGIMPTKQAVAEYNTLYGQGRNVAGCFHLTC